VRGLLTANAEADFGVVRAGDEVRTHDLLLGKETLYH
jgi:hypothetical protein